jgi:hypothetical protein
VVLAGFALVGLWVVGFALQSRGVSLQAGLPASLKDTQLEYSDYDYYTVRTCV